MLWLDSVCVFCITEMRSISALFVIYNKQLCVWFISVITFPISVHYCLLGGNRKWWQISRKIRQPWCLYDAVFRWSRTCAVCLERSGRDQWIASRNLPSELLNRGSRQKGHIPLVELGSANVMKETHFSASLRLCLCCELEWMHRNWYLKCTVLNEWYESSIHTHVIKTVRCWIIITVLLFSE